jgi:hypothetical protein
MFSIDETWSYKVLSTKLKRQLENKGLKFRESLKGAQ